MVSGSSDPDSFLDNAAEWCSTFVLFLKVATWLILSSTFMSIFHCFLSWGGKKKIGWQVLFFFTPCQEQEEKEPVFAKSVCICILRRCLRVLSVVYTPVTGYLFLHTTNCVYVCVYWQRVSSATMQLELNPLEQTWFTQAETFTISELMSTTLVSVNMVTLSLIFPR